MQHQPSSTARRPILGELTPLHRPHHKPPHIDWNQGPSTTNNKNTPSTTRRRSQQRKAHRIQEQTSEKSTSSHRPTHKPPHRDSHLDWNQGPSKSSSTYTPPTQKCRSQQRAVHRRQERAQEARPQHNLNNYRNSATEAERKQQVATKRKRRQGLNTQHTHPGTIPEGMRNLQKIGSRHWNPNRSVTTPPPTLKHDRKHRLAETQQYKRPLQLPSKHQHCALHCLPIHPSPSVSREPDSNPTVYSRTHLWLRLFRSSKHFHCGVGTPRSSKAIHTHTIAVSSLTRGSEVQSSSSRSLEADNITRTTPVRSPTRRRGAQRSRRRHSVPFSNTHIAATLVETLRPDQQKINRKALVAVVT
jgi:hypothetical protein